MNNNNNNKTQDTRQQDTRQEAEAPSTALASPNATPTMTELRLAQLADMILDTRQVAAHWKRCAMLRVFPADQEKARALQAATEATLKILTEELDILRMPNHSNL